MSENGEKKSSGFNPAGIGMGLAVGVGLGVALDNIGMGLAIGVALGAAFSVALGQNQKKQDPPEGKAPEEPEK